MQYSEKLPWFFSYGVAELDLSAFFITQHVSRAAGICDSAIFG